MATISRRSGYPNVLLVTGSDVYTSNLLGDLKNYLYGLTSSDNSPVKKGTHDYWIVYSSPGVGGGLWTGEDFAASPIPLRGTINMGGVPDPVSTAIAGQLSVLEQEAGHHWLVPSDLQFNINGSTLSMPTDVQLTDAINNETEFTGPALLARDNAHWSAYFKADGSPMDGLCYLEYPSEDGYNVWKSSTHCGINVSVGRGLPDTTTSTYCDLDLMIMGIKSVAEAYGGSNNGITWIKPRLAAPLPYHAGLFMAFSRLDQVMFGYDEDHGTLGVKRTDGTYVGSPVVITPNAHPLGHDFNGMSLRIIRQNNNYYFQAKIDNPLRGCIQAIARVLGWYRGEIKGVWDNAGSPGPVDPSTDFTDWKTVAILARQDAPQAIGMFVNKKDHPHMCDAAFYNLFLKQGSTERILQTNSVPSAITPGDYASLADNVLNIEQPSGSIFRQRDGRIHIVAPFSILKPDGTLEHCAADRFRHDSAADNSPKIITKAPRENFAFGTHAKIHRSIFTPWAGGYAANRTIWGKTESCGSSSVIVPSRITPKQTPPTGNTFKVAFIIVAANDSDIPDAMVQRLNDIRTYWDEAFNIATVGRRLSDSTL